MVESQMKLWRALRPTSPSMHSLTGTSTSGAMTQRCSFLQMLKD
jgi:hypothetical protein